MKTDKLIELLAHDVRPVLSFRRTFWIAAVCGAAIAGLFFFSVVGIRPDFYSALRSGRFLLKFFITIPLAIGASGLAVTLASPGARRGIWYSLVAFALVLLFGGVGFELWSLSPDMWKAKMIGHNAWFCLTLIPLLSLGPFASLLSVLQLGAPENPAGAGATVGLAASAMAATFYAANCDDDSPLFVLLWYPLATLPVMGTGWVLGRRYLSW